MTQGTLGFSFGGEFFREIIFFRDKPDLDKFKAEEFVFTAQASALAISAGVAAKADYKDGMAVFIMTRHRSYGRCLDRRSAIQIQPGYAINKRNSTKPLNYPMLALTQPES